MIWMEPLAGVHRCRASSECTDHRDTAGGAAESDTQLLCLADFFHLFISLKASTCGAGGPAAALKHWLASDSAASQSETLRLVLPRLFLHLRLSSLSSFCPSYQLRRLLSVPLPTFLLVFLAEDLLELPSRGKTTF